MAGRDEVYAVLVSLVADTLLLPNASVAEVVSSDGLENPPDGAPTWLAGRVTYNNRRLLVARFELLNGGSGGEDTRRTRIAVLQPVTTALRTGQYGIVCQGYPHLVTLNRTALRKESLQPTDNGDIVLTRVSIANTTALIPHLEKIEQMLAQHEAAPAIA